MAIYDQAATKAPTPTPTAQTTPEKRKQPEDLVPEENKVQKKDGASEGGGEKSAEEKAAADKKAKEERAAAVVANWEQTLGKWLGAPLAKIVLENVSLDALNGYVQDGLKAAGPALGDVLKDQAKPADKKQEEGLKAFSDALSGVITGQVDQWVKSPTGQKVLKAISDWVQDHPGWVMTIVGAAVIGGAIGAYVANPDLDLEVPFNLGKDWQVKAGIDLGKLREIAFQGASLVVANKNAGIKMKAEVKKDDEKNDAGDVTKSTQSGSVEVNVGKDKESQMTFAMNGKIVDTKDGLLAYTAGGKLELFDPASGAKVTVTQDGKWDNKGNKEDAFSYSASVGKDVTGSFTTNLKNATVVDTNGNIVSLSSRELKVAVGSKAAKFEASTKTEEKDGKESTTSTIGVSGKGQLGAGTMFEGSSNVSIGDDKVVVKLNGKMTATIAGKPVEMDAAYETDGVIKGRIKVGSGNEYREVIGEKKGDVVTFSTKQVFVGGSLEQKTTTDKKTGQSGQQTTVTAGVGKDQTVTASGGSEGSNVKYEGKDIGGSGVGINAGVGQDAEGKTNANVGVKYDKGSLKAYLDYTMKQGESTMGVGASVSTEDGWKFSGDLKLDEARMTELALKMGYQNPDEFKGFLLGYKQTWSKENQQYAHHFDALLEYSIGRWYARAQGGMDIMGGKLQKTNLDLGLGYKLNDKWTAIGGVQMNGMRNEQNNQFDMGYKPYVGLQYGGVGVAGYYDTQSKGGGIMLTIPFGR